MCTCGCADAPTEGCSHNMMAETCVSIDSRATTEWCTLNCILGDLVHPACDPFVDDVHTVCLCDCDDGELETSSTSEIVSSSSSESEDCDVVTFYSECDYTGDTL